MVLTWISKYWAGFVLTHAAHPEPAPSCSKSPFAGAGLPQKPRVLGPRLCVGARATVGLCGLRSALVRRQGSQGCSQEGGWTHPANTSAHEQHSVAPKPLVPQPLPWAEAPHHHNRATPTGRHLINSAGWAGLREHLGGERSGFVGVWGSPAELS